MHSIRHLASQKIDFLFHLLENDPFDLDVEGQAEELTWVNHSGQHFLLNYHGVTKQLWYSSPLSGAHHFTLDFLEKQHNAEWVCTRTGRSFNDILSSELSSLVGRAILLTNEGLKHA